MATAKEVKNHIKSIQDTKKITNAMYLISSTKLRKEREALEATEPYYDALRAEIRRIFQVAGNVESPFFYPKQGEACRPGVCGFLVITADKGLAGAYNANVLKKTMEMMGEEPEYRLFVVGEYGRQYFRGARIPLEEDFLFTAQNPSLHRAREICHILVEQYLRGQLNKIYVVYTEGSHHAEPQVTVERLLPFDRPEAEGCDRQTEGFFEFVPSPEEVLDHIVPSSITGFLYSALVESFYSEQSNRMAAMDAANQNAEALLGELQMQYHHLRQGSITQEITEISASARARNLGQKGGKQ